MFGLPTAKAVSAQEAKIADLKKHKGDVDAQVNEAQRQLYALKLGVGDSELLFNLWSKDRKAVWSKDRKAGVINVTAALAGDINAALGYHGAAGGAKDSFEAGVATAIELNPKAFESDMQGSVLFHEAVHLDDYELTQKLIRDYGKFVPVQEGRVAFDTWVRKQPNLTAGQKQLASDIVFGAFGTTEARAYVKTFLVAFDAGARQRAAASLLAYAKGMNDKRVPSPTQDERNPVAQELKAEVTAFRGKLDATARPDFDAAISTAVAANSSAWIRILEVQQPGQKRAVRKEEPLKYATQVASSPRPALAPGRALIPALVAFVLAAAPAAAEVRKVTVRYGPIPLSAYEVKRGDAVFNIPKPDVDGFITRMRARLVYEDGRAVPIANTMLHHVVMADLGTYIGEHRDPTCALFRMFDSESFLPLHGHRFYGLGEERHKLELPPGYGYPTRAADRWAMTYMLMNHLPKRETVFVEYTMDIETTAALQPVTPLWLDVRDCNLDPVYDVRGGGRRGSRTSRTTTWTAPTGGRIVFAAGHMHGGGRELRLSRPGCSDQTAFTSRPLWGLPSHPYYQVRPLLHEPGPIGMSSFLSEQGIPVAAGEQLKLTSTYDAELPHTRVMGIMLAAFVPDARVTQRCAPLPTDARTFWTESRGRTRMPRVKVPITAVDDRDGRARPIRRPPGATVAMRSRATVDVADFAFRPANVAVRRGSTLRWRFFDSELHNVTLANGPRGFSSDNLDNGRAFSQRFTAPGTYRLFCTLHPVTMTATVKVTP